MEVFAGKKSRTVVLVRGSLCTLKCYWKTQRQFFMDYIFQYLLFYKLNLVKFIYSFTHLKITIISFYVNINYIFSPKFLYFPKQNSEKYDNILHFYESLLISGLIKTAEFSWLLYSICCDILILIKNIKKIWFHTEM